MTSIIFIDIVVRQPSISCGLATLMPVMYKTMVAAASRKKGASQFPTQSYNAPKSGGPAAARAYPKDCAMPEMRAASRVVRVRRTNHIMTKLNANPVPKPNRITAGMMNCVRQPMISDTLSAKVPTINQTSGVWSLIRPAMIGPTKTMGSWVNWMNDSTHPDVSDAMPQSCSTTGSQAMEQ